VPLKRSGDQGRDVAGDGEAVGVRSRRGGAFTPAAARGVGIGHARDIDKPVERGGDPGPHWAAIANAVRIAEDFKPTSVVPFDEPGDQI
jgi:hypothetical protein